MYSTRKTVFSWAMLVCLSCFSYALSQAFSANTYYQQCLRFEATGDFETARQSCLNALEIDPSSAETKLALARSELALGNIGSAETRLNSIRNEIQSAEPYVLLAEAAMAGERLDEAESHLATARRRLVESPNSELEGRLTFAEAQLAEAKTDFDLAREKYRNAVAGDALNVRYRLALAGLLLEEGKVDEARSELENYQSFTGNTRNPELLSLLGHVKWAQSDLESAVRDLETAVALRGTRNTAAQAEDLRDLALIYYGLGDTRAGGLALSAATERGTLLFYLLNRSVLWLLLLGVLVAIHLIGESRAAGTSNTPSSDAPSLWSVGTVYGVFFASAIVAALVGLVYSVVRYDNYLAVATPLQSADVRALFFATLSVLLFILTTWRTGKHGRDPVEALLGGAERAGIGVLVGVVLIAGTLAYLVYIPPIAALQGFYLDFSRLTPLLLAAAVLIPLSEVFFRTFALEPFTRRYGQASAVILSGALSALVFAAPLPLVLAIGLILAEMTRRFGGGLNTLVAQLVLNLGLVIGVAFSPWVRGLFF